MYSENIQVQRQQLRLEFFVWLYVCYALSLSLTDRLVPSRLLFEDMPILNYSLCLRKLAWRLSHKLPLRIKGSGETYCKKHSNDIGDIVVACN